MKLIMTPEIEEQAKLATSEMCKLLDMLPDDLGGMYGTTFQCAKGLFGNKFTIITRNHPTSCSTLLDVLYTIPPDTQDNIRRAEELEAQARKLREEVK